MKRAGNPCMIKDFRLLCIKIRTAPLYQRYSPYLPNNGDFDTKKRFVAGRRPLQLLSVFYTDRSLFYPVHLIKTACQQTSPKLWRIYWTLCSSMEWEKFLIHLYIKRQDVKTVTIYFVDILKQFAQFCCGKCNAGICSAIKHLDYSRCIIQYPAARKTAPPTSPSLS